MWVRALLPYVACCSACSTDFSTSLLSRELLNTLHYYTIELTRRGSSGEEADQQAWQCNSSLRSVAYVRMKEENLYKLKYAEWSVNYDSLIKSMQEILNTRKKYMRKETSILIRAEPNKFLLLVISSGQKLTSNFSASGKFTYVFENIMYSEVQNRSIIFAIKKHNRNCSVLNTVSFMLGDFY